MDKRDKQEFVGEQKVVLKDEGEVTNRSYRRSRPCPAFWASRRAQLDPAEDRLTQLAAWLTDPKNEDFARAQANRVWYHLMGRGLVDPSTIFA